MDGSSRMMRKMRTENGKPNTLVLFDIDGTLLSAGRAARESVLAALASVYGWKASNGHSHDFSGKTDPQIVCELVEESVGRERCHALLSAALEKIMFVGGSSAFAQANALQRFWRDFNMAARHAIYLPDFGYEVYGAMRLGISQTVVPPNLV